MRAMMFTLVGLIPAWAALYFVVGEVMGYIEGMRVAPISVYLAYFGVVFPFFGALLWVANRGSVTATRIFGALSFTIYLLRGREILASLLWVFLEDKPYFWNTIFILPILGACLILVFGARHLSPATLIAVDSGVGSDVPG